MLTVLLMISGIDFGAAAYSYFFGSVIADEPDISAAGISIDVYGSKLRYSANGLKRYEHYYVTTVKTDGAGRFSFPRPSTKTLLKVDLDTLPYGTGVNERTRLVSSRYDDTFTLSYIDDIRISKYDGGNAYKADLLAADGTLLFANSEITDKVTSSAADITYDKLNSVTLDRTITVRAAGLTKSRTFGLDISKCTVPGKLTRLLAYGIIDEPLTQQLAADYKEDTATPDDLRPIFENERRFAAGGFMLHSEQGTKDIGSYESALGDIVDIYFGKYGFPEPYHEYVSGSTSVRDQYFHIYVVDPDSIKIKSDVSPKNIIGKTMQIDKNDFTKGCYIVLAPDDDLLRFRWTLAHEIFHGIAFRYTGKDQAGWFKEAIADYGSTLCINGSVPALTKHMTNYLNSTIYPLSNSASYKNRSYGTFLLPLYIHNNLGGVQTIKNILSAYANTNSAYAAIDNGLKATNRNYSFAKAFAGFKDMNAYTDFYKLRDLSSDRANALVREKADRTMTASFDGQSTIKIPDTTLNVNSAAYFEFLSPAASKGKLTVTVETDGKLSDSSVNLILKGRNIIIPVRKNASELTTFVLSDFGGSYSSVVLTAGNTSMAKNKQICFAASAYFEEQ